MALLFMDSFDHYATADITEKWTQIVSPESGDGAAPVIGAYGRNTSQGLRCQKTTNSTYIARPVGITLAPTGAVCIVGVACKYNQFSTLSQSTCGSEIFFVAGKGSNYLARCLNINSPLWFARVNTDGTISVLRDTNNTSCVVLGTTDVALQVGVWAYVEIKVTISTTVGTVDVRINGVSALSLSSQNTRGSGAEDAWTSVRLGYLHSNDNVASYADYDDLVVMDGVGSVNNAFIGDVTISALYPNGAGTTTGWTPSAGANYDCVNEALVNDDTDYNSTATLNAKDTYAMQDCAAGADIRAVQILASVRKGAEGPGQIKLVTRSNSTDYDGGALGIGGTAYSYLREIRETDPATAAAWSESGWNAVEIGLKKTG